ncbi:MAG: hypothetical protein CML98_05675 [Rhodobiaceae bacterium]|nr:hypothetical protein [Rhodobiaceae bacterium]|tara:strand:+ start:15631 stop:16128 length:498 start_codon:yes stop_codon:yes gene_type:complete
MDKHCPVFILECAATFICENFLSGTLPLETICKKVRDHIVTEYKELPIEDLQDIAEAFLRVLSEANVDEAEVVLRNYAFERVTFRRSGKERNWESMLFDPMKGLKSFKLDLKLFRRNFQAFLFRYKQQKRTGMPESWELKNFKTNDFLMALGSIEFSPFDILDQA